MSSILNKSFQDCTEPQLMLLQKEAKDELKRRAFASLELVANQYIQAYGAKEGIEEMGEDLCKRIAPNAYHNGWDQLVNHLVKISG